MRPELQTVFQAAFDFVKSYDGQSESVSTNSRQTNGRGKRVNAFELARALCETYVNRPITTLIMDNDEELAVKRVASTMAMRYDSVALPLKRFLQKTMKLPVSLHDTVRDAVLEPHGVKTEVSCEITVRTQLGSCRRLHFCRLLVQCFSTSPDSCALCLPALVMY